MAPTTDAAFAARVASGVFAGGAAISAILLVVPHSGDFNEAAYAAVGIAAAVAALLLWLAAGRIPAWVLSVVCALGTLLVSVDLYVSGVAQGGPATDNGVFYVWVALYAAYFLPHRAALLQLTLVAAAYLAVLLVVAEPAAVATRWVQTIGTLAVGVVLVQLLRERVSELVARLTDAARTDPLTGLHNRRGFEELMEVEVERAQRTGRPLSVLLGDLDNFKQVNDHHGHAGGDSALVRVGEILEYHRRRTDAVARTGGEEFAVVLPETDRNAAYAIAERIRARVEGAFAHKHVQLTMSIGVATFPLQAPTARMLVTAADQALYAAKELGRNLSVIFSEEVAAIVSAETKEQAHHAEVHLATLMSLAEALDLRDMGTAAHCQLVGRYCALVAEQLGLPPTRVDRVRIAGILHDIGKIGLPDAILQKPGPLSREDWDKVRMHPEIGAGMLASPSFHDIRAWVLTHHERPDGKGYPQGLVGQEIPLEARIIAVADAYDAMTAQRPYRAPMGHEVARTELLKRAGTSFDPRVVSALLSALERERRPAPEPTLEAEAVSPRES
jgi:diguanylate cyclase (GGDEF)-like protein